jgi:leader peptidase (prepilin peptidase) / N-methyltransferase
LLLASGGALLGLIVGSFLATLVVRWPEGRSVLTGRSTCDGCGRALSAFELIPVASHIALGGTCRACGAAIAKDHFWIETLCGLSGFAAIALSPDWGGLLAAISIWLLIALAALDLKHFWLPDALTITLAFVGLAAGLADVSPLLVDRLIGGVAGFGSLSLIALAYRMLRKREGLGGGDPKLFGAIGLWLGWEALPFVLLGASGLGLVWVAASSLQGAPLTRQDRLPLGALLAASAVALWMFTR